MEMQKKHFLLTMLTGDTALTLARFTGILGRWGCEIETLVVSQDQAPGVTRVTSVFCGEPEQADRISKQTARLHDVSALQLVSHNALHNCNSLRVRISCDRLSHAEACRLCSRHNAMISGRTENEMTIETVGSPKNLAFFLNDVAPHGLLFTEMPNITFFPSDSDVLTSEVC